MNPLRVDFNGREKDQNLPRTQSTRPCMLWACKTQMLNTIPRRSSFVSKRTTGTSSMRARSNGNASGSNAQWNWKNSSERSSHNSPRSRHNRRCSKPRSFYFRSRCLASTRSSPKLLIQDRAPMNKPRPVPLLVLRRRARATSHASEANKRVRRAMAVAVAWSCRRWTRFMNCPRRPRSASGLGSGLDGSDP